MEKKSRELWIILFLVAAIQRVFKHVGKRVFVFRLMQGEKALTSGYCWWVGHPLAYASTHPTELNKPKSGSGKARSLASLGWWL